MKENDDAAADARGDSGRGTPPPAPREDVCGRADIAGIPVTPILGPAQHTHNTTHDMNTTAPKTACPPKHVSAAHTGVGEGAR